LFFFFRTGGAIDDKGSEMTITDCTFTRNHAPYGGVLATFPDEMENGTLVFLPLEANFVRSYFQDNNATIGGYLLKERERKSIFILFLLFRAFSIGFNRSITLTFDTCQISRNHATLTGGAFMSHSDETVPNVFLTNSEVKHNTAQSGA